MVSNTSNLLGVELLLAAAAETGRTGQCSSPSRLPSYSRRVGIWDSRGLLGRRLSSHNRLTLRGWRRIEVLVRPSTRRLTSSYTR